MAKKKISDILCVRKGLELESDSDNTFFFSLEIEKKKRGDYSNRKLHNIIFNQFIWVKQRLF